MSITRTLAENIANYGNENSFGSKLRAKRLAPLLEIIEAVFNTKGSVNIIDIGGTEIYWKTLMPTEILEKFNIHITVVNLPGSNFPENYDRFNFVYGSGCELSMFDDNTFDIAHSNSVIEHVGDWENMKKFARETKRVAKKYFVQTPNYWFPVEPHCMTPFFHWLPKPARVWLVLNFALGHWEKANTVDDAVSATESARLLNKKMFYALFDDAVGRTEKLFLLPKSFIAIRS